MSSPVSQPSSVPAAPKKNPSQARRAAALAAVTLAAACAGCTGVKVRPEDELAWLASCSAEARETVKALGIYPSGPPDNEHADVTIVEGPNVLIHWSDCEPVSNQERDDTEPVFQDIECKSVYVEVREGDVTVTAIMSPLSASGTLIGTIREGSDRVYFRFHELRKADGRTFPICGIGAQSFSRWGPGVAKTMEGGLPASERTPGYIPISTGRFGVRLAPYLRNQGQGDAKVN